MTDLPSRVHPALPDDAARATLAGRIWQPERAGPSVIAIRNGTAIDVSESFPTMRDLCEAPDPAAACNTPPARPSPR